MSAGGSRPTSFWLDEETLMTLTRLVEDLGMSRSHVVREAIKAMAGNGGEVNVTEARRLIHQLEKVLDGG